MGDTWILDLTDFVDSDGNVPGATKIGYYFFSIASTIFKQKVADSTDLQIPCRRRPGRRPCSGTIHGFLDINSGDMIWYCKSCDDNGIISNWETIFLD